MMSGKINSLVRLDAKHDAKGQRRRIRLHVANVDLLAFLLVSLHSVKQAAVAIQSLICQPFAHFPVQIANQDPFRQQWPGTGTDSPGRGVLRHMRAMGVLSRLGWKPIRRLSQTLLITTPLVQTCAASLSHRIV